MVANNGTGEKIGQADELRGMVLLFGVLLGLLVAAPFLEQVRGGRILLPAVGIAVPLAALRAVASSRRHVTVAVVLAIPSLLVAAIHVSSDAPSWQPMIAPLAFFGFATWVIGRMVFGRPVVTVEVLAGAACVYLMIAITWWFAYLAAERFAPGSFAGLSGGGGEASRTDLLYFSFVTLTTLGYGDIVPVAAHARGLVTAQAAIGVLYPAVLIARLVGLYAGHRDVA
jgi:hypothetical protein